MTGTLQLLTISATVALSAYYGPLFLSILIPRLQVHIPIPVLSTPPAAPAEHSCPQHAYTTQLISLNPLLILIHNFIPPSERADIIAAGTPLLIQSPVTGSGSGDSPSQARTSHSAPLPPDDKAVSCVLGRAASFLGTLLLPGRDEMGPAQMVRYTPGQKFDPHHDWFKRPRITDEDAAVGRRRLYNRVATLFVVLQADNVTRGSGETWFPLIKPIEGGGGSGGGGGEGEVLWREHEDGGLAFKPIPGNALFWVNLLPNGTGDARTLHAGLPVEGGIKVGMNIWPRRFFGPDA
jgi:prolyl 4-hydroxylase